MISFPLPSSTRFSNGLTLLFLKTENDPVSACHLFLPLGASNEGEKPSGITTLMWSLLLQGTKKRNAKKIAEDIESLGASISGGTNHDYSEISCYSTSDYFLDALSIFREVLLEPLYTDEEIDKEKMALKASIRAKKDNIFTTTYESLTTRLYENHPYSYPSSGSEPSVSNIYIKDLLNRHKNHIVPRKAILSIATSLPYEKIVTVVDRMFGPKIWEDNSRDRLKNYPSPEPLKESSTNQIPSKFEQAYLIMAYQASRVGWPEYIPLKVLNSLLGGGMSARLFQKLRENEGLAYDIGSFYPSRRWGSGFHIYMGLQKSRIDEAKQRIINEVEILTKQPVSKEELDNTKNYLKGTFILDHQTNSQRAHYAGWWTILGLDPNYDNEYIHLIDQITPEKLHETAHALFIRPMITVESLPLSKTPSTPPSPHAS